MYTYNYNKLVRDKIPEKINSEKGRKANFKILNNEEYLAELNKKLIEESHEFIEANSVEELADLIEVAESIMKLKNICWEEVRKYQTIKNEKNGKFNDKIYLISVDEDKRNIKEEIELNKSFRKK